MKVSLVVVSWNGAQYLPACLTAALAQTYPQYEVIVVDNASPDGAADLVAERFPQVRLLRNTQNLGYAGGMNVGLRAAQGEVLVLLDQDTEMGPHWLAAAVHCLASDERTGIVGGKVFFPDWRTFQHAGGALAYPLALEDHAGCRKVDRGQFDEVREVDYVSAAIGLRRGVLDRVGLLDEGFFPGFYAGADLCRRARRAGYRIVYTPAATLAHYEATGVGRDSYAYFCSIHAGRLHFVLKHYTLAQFQQDFLPAEHDWLASRPILEEKRALYHAYVGVRANLAAIRAAGRAPGDEPAAPEEARLLADALQGLEVAAAAAISPPGRDPLAVYMEQAARRREVEELTFTSATPLIGPLLAGLRSAVNGISTRWYVRRILQQQNEFNEAVFQSLQEVCGRLGQAMLDLREVKTQVALLEMDVANLAARAARLERAEEDVESSVGEVEYAATENDRQTVALATELARLRMRVQALEDDIAAFPPAPKEGKHREGR